MRIPEAKQGQSPSGPSRQLPFANNNNMHDNLGCTFSMDAQGHAAINQFMQRYTIQPLASSAPLMPPNTILTTTNQAPRHIWPLALMANTSRKTCPYVVLPSRCCPDVMLLAVPHVAKTGHRTAVHYHMTSRHPRGPESETSLRFRSDWVFCTTCLHPNRRNIVTTSRRRCAHCPEVTRHPETWQRARPPFATQEAHQPSLSARETTRERQV